MILTMTSVKDITNDDELDTLIGLIADGNRDARGPFDFEPA